MTIDSVLRDATTHQDDPRVLGRLTERLAHSAEEEDLLDVAFTTHDSPFGPLLLAATARGLARVAFAIEQHDRVLEDLARRLSPRVLSAPGRLEAVRRELDEYFGERRTAFDLPLDRTLSSGFRGTVQRHLPDIPYGSTETYSQVAVAVGNPRAVRAVGSACATNPLPIVVPCHRVLRADGTIGQYIGGSEAKRALLALEHAVPHGRT